jgi:hypothetical protein
MHDHGHDLLAAGMDRSPEPTVNHRTMIVVGLIGLLLGGLIVVIVPMLQPVRGLSYRSESNDRLYNIAIAIWDYESNAKHLLPAASEALGPPPVDLHNWQTHLLPFVEQKPLYGHLDLQQPWTDPVNEPHFHVDLDIYLNPSITVTHSTAGLGLSHYAANSQVLVAGTPLKRTDLKDGESNTLLTGEISTSLPPWGQPRNVRDPAIGLHKGPASFGGPWADRSTQMTTFDAKVHRLSENIDPAALKALATPAGGETVHSFGAP